MMGRKGEKTMDETKNIYYLCTVETFCDFLLWQELFIRFPVQ